MKLSDYQYLFFNDYSEGAHPRILEALNSSNDTQELGYGEDSFTLQATELIQEAISNKTAAIHFVSSGTLANIVCLSYLLKPYESVIALESGHINVYEAGAIEATGHKVHELAAVDGKLTPDAIQEFVNRMTDEHMVKPKVVYISQSTEIGSIYSKKELENIAEVVKRNNLYLYIDGARIGHAIMGKNADINLQQIADLTDIFYIGGTKNGGLMGEAIVIPNKNLHADFRRHMRQKGALLAKTRTVSLQFVEFFKDDLYFANAKYANQMAQQLADGLSQKGYRFLTQALTNQLFPILPNSLIAKLKQSFGFYEWQKLDSENTAIRLVTSWKTSKLAIEQFLASL
jgi:threonine aldolase